MKIGIIGNGFVGGATALFACQDVEVLIYDRNKGKCSPGIEKTLDLNKCDIIFVCLPTPMGENGECHTSLVEESVKELKSNGYKGSIFVRSTVPVGFCESVGASFMPEFLTEANWKDDFKKTHTWVIGSNNEKDKQKIKELIHCAFDNSKIDSNLIDFLSESEAEMVKLVRNCFLAVKVSFFNEIFQFCLSRKINFNRVKDTVIKDSRVGASHTRVPGNNGMLGFGGTCLPKDSSSLSFQMKKENLFPYILSAAIMRNNLVDCPNSSWKEKGRSVI